MVKLIIINGAPGVGKSVVGNLLFSRLDNSTFLDGDDVWRINPFEVNEITKGLVEENIASVLRNYIEAQYEYVILTWVLHQQSIIDNLLSKLNDLKFNTRIFTLIADEEVLLERLKLNKTSKTDPDIALDRLKQSLKLTTEKIDTSSLKPGNVVDKILDLLQKPRVNSPPACWGVIHYESMRSIDKPPKED